MKYEPEKESEPEAFTVELPWWMWKQILGKVKHDMRTAKSLEAQKDAESMKKAIEFQIEQQRE